MTANHTDAKKPATAGWRRKLTAERRWWCYTCARRCPWPQHPKTLAKTKTRSPSRLIRRVMCRRWSCRAIRWISRTCRRKKARAGRAIAKDLALEWRLKCAFEPGYDVNVLNCKSLAYGRHALIGSSTFAVCSGVRLGAHSEHIACQRTSPATSSSSAASRTQS